MSTQQWVGIHSSFKILQQCEQKAFGCRPFPAETQCFNHRTEWIVEASQGRGWHWVGSVRVWSSQAGLRNWKNHFPRLCSISYGPCSFSSLIFSHVCPTFLIILAEKLSLSLRAQIMVSDLSLCKLSAQQPMAHWLSC